MAGFFRCHGSNEPLDHTIVSWTRFYHDLRLIVGVCTPVLSGSRAVPTSPAAFLERPAQRMRLLAPYPSASAGAPNFPFDWPPAKQHRRHGRA